MLEFGLPIYESYLDKLSSWNQGVVFHFIIKALYSHASMQINSVKTVNTGSAYHGRKDYKQGFQFEEIKKTVMANLNLSIENNPLVLYLNSEIENYEKQTPGIWGAGSIDISKFKIGEEIKGNIGNDLNFEILNYFNMCGNMLNYQSKWWKSNLYHSTHSGTIDKIWARLKSCQKEQV